ncbi:hypothetical protein Bca52824_010051 [Brassica carinata]|uniref:No apical meristem-associated C-terminal domain-containing protein n=1 Tax=Brassica carinata TaxID=52824 RepID=A0A8X8BAH6_BRACI|nr:hypothetical protein Bca52824_010051 [Brassica carinata]
MDSNPYRPSTRYVDLLTSQHGFSYVEDSVQLSSSSQVPVFGTQGAEASSSPQDTPGDQEERPPGVKAAKGKKKKNVEGKETLSQFQTMWKIKQKDLVSKERLSKMRILESLLAKKDGLDEFEDALTS